MKNIIVAILLLTALSAVQYKKPINTNIILPETELAVLICGDEFVVPSSREVQFLIYIPGEYRQSCLENSQRYGIPVEQIYRIMFMESRLGKYQISLKPNKNGSVDKGVMHLNSQYMDYFAENFFDGDPEDFEVYNSSHSIQVACAYLIFLEDKVNSWEGALISYNCGPGTYLEGRTPVHSRNYAKVVLGEELLSPFIDLKGIKWN